MNASRIVGICGWIVAVTGSLLAGGLLSLVPPKYAVAPAIVAGLGATAAALSERIQGGASTVNVAQAKANEAEGTAKPS